MLHRPIVLHARDYRASPKIADVFSNVLHRAGWGFDHVAIDVGSFIGSASRLTRDLGGHERDRETVKLVHRQLINVILRRVQPKKSLAIFLDGSEPLWKVRHMRLYPGKRFDEKFYRSAASPMPYLLEEKLRGIITDWRSPSSEFLISGPAVPGPVEMKLSSWLHDLATRIVVPATNPPRVSDVTSNDTFCLVGGADLFLAGLGATPFHNVTTLSLTQGELMSMSLHDALEWLSMDHLLRSTPSPDGAEAEKNVAHLELQRRLASARTDIVLLYLLCNGLSATDLPGAGVAFCDIMDAYKTVSSSEGAGVTDEASGPAQAQFSSALFREVPLTAANFGVPSLRLRAGALARVLARAARRSLNAAPRVSSSSGHYLEVLLQTHGMLCGGGMPNIGWTPADAGHVSEKSPSISIENLVAHLQHIAAASGTNGELHASRNRAFALTGLESLLLTSPNAETIEQVLPVYMRGHTLPPGVAKDLVETRGVQEALVKARSILHVAQEEGGNGKSVEAPHPAVQHSPSHYYVRTPGSRGPPAGWSYYSVNIGIKSEAMNIRYAVNASDHMTPRIFDECGLSKRNLLQIYDDVETKGWREVPCEKLVSGEVSCADGSNDVKEHSTLRLLTWNVQFSRHSGKRTPLGRDGIDWCTPTRYVALSKVLQEADADIIAMQEVEAAWCEYLAAQPWVREGYALTCGPDGHALQPWGVLMLVRKTLPVVKVHHANVPAFSGHTSVMPEVTIAVPKGVPPVTVGSMHLLAPYNASNISNRETQVQNLIKRLRTDHAGEASIVMGDFNDCAANMFRVPEELGYKDAWELLHGDGCGSHGRTASDADTSRGYTIDGLSNPYAAKIIEEEFYGRADRVLVSARHLQPIHAELVGTRSVLTLLEGSGRTTQVDKPTLPIPDYLYPSDHFGVLVEFQAM